MITQLMKLGPLVVDTEAMNALNEIYNVVTKSGVTRLKSNTRLASLLSYEDERDIKQKQKYETVIDEMSNVSQRVQGTVGSWWCSHTPCTPLDPTSLVCQ